MFGGQFGRIPSVETRVDEKSETRELLQQVWYVGVVIFIGFALFYVVVNVLFSEHDLTWVVDGILASMCTGLFFIAHKIAGRYTTGTLEFSTAEKTVSIKNSTWLGWVFFFLWIALMSLVTPFLVMILAFPSIANWSIDFWQSLARLLSYFVVVAFLSAVSPIIAFYYRINFKEIPDQTHGAIETARSMADARARVWEAKQMKKIEEEDEGEDIIEGEATPIEPTPLLRAAPVELPKLSQSQRQTLSIREFLEGVAAGRWTTSRSSYEGKDITLPGSGLKLTRSLVDGVIKTWLIKSSYAALDNPDQKNSGWHLLYEADYIIKYMDGEAEKPSGSRNALLSVDTQPSGGKSG